jgi:hypothetical protein
MDKHTLENLKDYIVKRPNITVENILETIDFQLHDIRKVEEDEDRRIELIRQKRKYNEYCGY